MYERYNEYPKRSPNYVEFVNAVEYLKSLEIGQDDKIIVHFDCSPNYCLYSLKMQGWTDYNGRMDSAKISEYISHGAKYLILCQKEDIDNAKFRSFIRNKIGQFETVSIYRLDNLIPDKYPLGYHLVLSCDAEKLSPNSNNLLTQPNNIKLPDRVQLYKEQTHSGTNCILLDEKFQYGFTYLMNVLPGDHYYVSVWQHPLKDSIGGVIVIEDTIGNPFRIEGRAISKKDSSGWELMDLFFKVPDDYFSSVVNIYVWNANKTPLLVDDFKIMKTDVK